MCDADLTVDTSETRWKNLITADTEYKARALIRVNDEFLLCFKSTFVAARVHGHPTLNDMALLGRAGVATIAAFGYFISRAGKASRDISLEWFGSPKTFGPCRRRCPSGWVST